MCEACSQALSLQRDGTSFQRHIDSITVPILVVDSNNTVVTMNTEASNVFGSGQDARVEEVLGRVFDCFYSSLPEGCGRHIHCAGCLIRRSVATTFETGKPQILIPATLSVESLDHVCDIVLYVTTVKNDGKVLLRVEKAKVG
jgi:nitrogen-specific signal transduction histidine kinase